MSAVCLWGLKPQEDKQLALHLALKITFTDYTRLLNKTWKLNCMETHIAQSRYLAITAISFQCLVTPPFNSACVCTHVTFPGPIVLCVLIGPR